MLTHMPTDDRCEHCVLGKTQSILTCAHSFGRTTSRFGGIVTADHTSFTEHDGSHGLHGKAMMLVVEDVHIGVLGARPSATKHSDAAREYLDHYIGNARIRTCYSDHARDIVKAVQDLG